MFYISGFSPSKKGSSSDLSCEVGLKRLAKKKGEQGEVKGERVELHMEVKGEDEASDNDKMLGWIELDFKIEGGAEQQQENKTTPDSSHAERGLLDVVGVKASPVTSVDGGLSPTGERCVFPVLSSSWLEAHLNDRMMDCREIDQMQRNMREFKITEEDKKTEPTKRRFPANFKPSAAKGQGNLGGIPINLHTQLFVREGGEKGGGERYCYTTCGAPADHGKGFKKGGLKRLEERLRTNAERGEDG